MLPAKKQIAAAVQRFWETWRDQRRAAEQTGESENRAAVTGGKHLDGFVELLRAVLRDAGASDDTVFDSGRDEIMLPGYSLPAKQWDVMRLAVPSRCSD